VRKSCRFEENVSKAQSTRKHKQKENKRGFDETKDTIEALFPLVEN
jgi:hypothetical protein